MKAAQLLHKLGQSMSLDNIPRGLAPSGALKKHIFLGGFRLWEKKGKLL